jgi:hypothetical protein
VTFVKRSTNPFYVLLVAAGIAFALTACAYSVMTLKAVRPPEAQAPSAGGGRDRATKQVRPSRPLGYQAPTAGGAALLVFLDEHGAGLMAGELALLALATVAAIGTDRYWGRRACQEHRAKQESQPPGGS